MISKAGKWVGVKAEKFPEFDDHFKKHLVDTGLPWLGRAFASADEYLVAAKSVVTNPSAKKVLYYNQSLNEPRLGYLLDPKKNGKVFLVAVGEDGTIRTFFQLDGGWSRVVESPSFMKLFKIDDF